MARDAYHPNVFRSPTGITQTLLYDASLRIPQPDLHGASGSYTPEYIRTMTASAGDLMFAVDPNTGVANYFVQMRSRPVDR